MESELPYVEKGAGGGDVLKPDIDMVTGEVQPHRDAQQRKQQYLQMCTVPKYSHSQTQRQKQQPCRLPEYKL